MRGRGAALQGLLFSLMVLAWSGNYLFVKVGLAVATPLWLATLRASVGAAGTAVYLLLRRVPGTLAPSDRAAALLLGIPNTAAFLGLWFVAAQYVAVGEAAVVIYTYPIWVALLSSPLLGQRLGWGHGAAVAGGFAGVFLVSEPWVGASGAVPFVPFLLLLVAAVCWGTATVLFQRRFRPDQLAEANGYQLASGSAVLLAAAFLLQPGALPGPTGTLALSVAWMGLFGTTFAYIVWFWLLERHRAASASAYLFLVPLGALALGVVFTGESVDLVQAAGVALVAASIYGVPRGRSPGR